MTITEQLHAAWETVQSKKSLLKMFEEIGVKSDDIEKLVERISLVREEYLSKMNESNLEKVSQMLAIAGLTMEELVEYETRPRNPKSGSRNYRSTYTVVAYYKGKAVNRVGLMPKWAKELGWNSREDIPEEYWTPQHRDHIEAQRATL